MNKQPYKRLYLIITAILFVAVTLPGLVTCHHSTAANTAFAQARNMWPQDGFVEPAKTIFQLNWGAYMYEVKNNNPSPELSPQKQPQSDRNSKVRELEEKCRRSGLIFRKDIQLLLKLAYRSSESIYQSAIHRLETAVEAYEVEKRRVPDSFKPYGPECLLSQGNLRILDQIDGVKWMIPVDTPLTGVLILGPQKGGKSRLIIRLCQEILRVNPGITITVVDPKDGFRDYASALSAERIDIADVAFDLKPPPNIDRRTFVLEFMPPLADTAGLIYGVEPLNEAALIALAQLDDYAAAIVNETELCLKDIYVDLSLVREASSGRRMGYREAAQTALHRIIGDRGLFACRRGISMEKLCTRNTILDTRSITDDMTCRTLALYFLYWKYQESRYKPETNKLQHLIIIDDASRYIGTPGDQFGAISRTSPLGHIFAQLRSTGTGLIAATQLPAFVDPSVLALSRTMLVVGGLSGAQHLKVATDFMLLDEEQKKAVVSLSTREAVGFSPGTVYKGVVHGWVPIVPDPPATVIGESADDGNEFEVEPWHNLAEIPASAAELAEVANESESHPKPTPSGTPSLALEGLSLNAQKILWDCVTYPFSAISVRISRLNMGSGAFEKAKNEVCEKGFVIESAAGQTHYLILTDKTCEAFSVPNPYKRAASIEHAFYVQLHCFLLGQDPYYKTVRAESPIGTSGNAGDIAATAYDGTMYAYEVCLGTSHVLANVTKYQNTAFAKVILLARNHELREAIKGLVKLSGLDADLMAKIDFMHFSQLLRRQRQLYRY